MTVKDTNLMIAGMTPVLKQGTWAYCCETATTKAAGLIPEAFAVMRETEGVTLILPSDIAAKHGYDVALTMRLITLSVFSDLEGVGLTAAVAQALSGGGISCNVVAAYHHDHVFVPKDDAERAVSFLKERQQLAAKE